MSTASEHANLEAVGGRCDDAAATANRSSRSDHDVLPKNHVRFWETSEEILVDHCLSAFRRLLRRLKDWHQGSPPDIAGACKQTACSDQPGHMHVMTTRVHYRNCVTLAVLCRNGACVGQAGLLLHRQRVHVRPEHHGWTFTISQDANYACLPNTSGNFIACGSQFFSRNFGCSRLLHRKLGMRVDVFIECLEVRQEFIEFGLRSLLFHR